MTSDPNARKDNRPSRPADEYDIASAHRENDRRDLAAILTAAGFPQATFTAFMTTATPGFAVRSDVPYFERTGKEQLHITLELRYAQDYDAARDAKTLADWAEAVERAGGWSVDYDTDCPREGIVAMRRTS